MSDLIPIEHKEDAQKLTGDAIVELTQIWLRSGGRVYISNSKERTWRDHTYTHVPHKITGVGRYSDEKVSRPQLTVVNPGNIFGPLIRDGELNRAEVHQFRILKDHYEQNLPIYQSRSWTIMRVSNLVKNKAIVFEMRDQTDGHNFICPARMFIPPEFPMVSLR